MFNLFKKKVTVQEYGHQTWLFCCDSAESFYLQFKPKFQAEGYLNNPMADRKFMDESMHLHIWVVFCALGKENRNVLDVVSSFAMDFNMEQQDKQVSIRDRYDLYYQAYSKDMEELQINKCSWPRGLGKTAIQCLVNYKSLSSEFLEMEVQVALLENINTVRKIRNEVKIVGS
jgi:hypothetical protein